jgi:hypothetical protein
MSKCIAHKCQSFASGQKLLLSVLQLLESWGNRVSWTLNDNDDGGDDGNSDSETMIDALCAAAECLRNDDVPQAARQQAAKCFGGVAQRRASLLDERRVADALQRSLTTMCDAVRWETRDTAVQLARCVQLARSAAAAAAPPGWRLVNARVALLWRDPQQYVRASALLALSALLDDNDDEWHDIASIAKSLNDSEAFVRRAACQLFATLLAPSSPLPSSTSASFKLTRLVLETLAQNQSM